MRTLEKEVLKQLVDNNLQSLPQNYTRAFYQLAKDKSMDIDELVYLERFVTNLDKSEKDILPEDIITYYELAEVLNYRIKKSEITRFIKHLSFLMRPSVDNTITYEIEKLILELSKDPTNLIKDKFINKLISASDKRVSKDRVALKNKSKDIKTITDLMITYFDKALQDSQNVDRDVMDINEKIKDSDDQDIVKLKGEFEKLIDSFHNVLNKNQEDLKKGQAQCQKLQEKIEMLEKNILEIQKDKDIDFLTGLLNRRGFNTEIQKVENEYEIFGNNYAVVFFDLDHFKDVNDNYGHECGDVILSTFAKLLKQLTRVEDIVARYGGEEFIALIHYEDNEELEKYVTRVKYMVNKNRFKYKDLRVKITFSAGVALREKYENYDDAINTADSILYKAKSGGRNRIFFDDETIL